MIKYTDTTIKYYTEIWAIKRLSKQQHILKNGLLGTGMLMVSGLPVFFREPYTLYAGFVHVSTAAVMGFLGSWFYFASAERSYRKFVRYQEAKQLADPRPGAYFN